MSPPLPSAVVVWAPIDRCRVVVAGAFGLKLVSSSTLTTLADSRRAVRAADACCLAVAAGAILVGRISARRGPLVTRIDRDGSHRVPLPHGVQSIKAMTDNQDDVIVATADARVLRLTPTGVRTLVSLPGVPAVVALSSNAAAAVVRTKAADRVLAGRIPSGLDGLGARAPRLPDNAGHVAPAANHETVAVGVDLDSAAGAPQHVLFDWSRNSGRTWHSIRLSGFSELGSVAVADNGDFYASMYDTGVGRNGIFRSSDGEAWHRVPGVSPGARSVRLASKDGVVWALIGDQLAPIPR